MDAIMQTPYVRKRGTGRWIIGNDRFECTLTADPQSGTLRLQGTDGLEGWLPAPAIQVEGQPCHSLTLCGAEIDGERPILRLRYTGPDIEVQHCLCPSPSLPAWRSWTRVRATGDAPVEGLCRFDAMHLRIAVGEAEPQVAYLLGWLFGPRADAPGRPPLPFPYPSFLPHLLYGDPTPPPAPVEQWTSSTLRLVKERLTKLPLRSGKRSTYDNYPWATVLDPQWGGGFFAGFEWSGTWRIDLEHRAHERCVSLSVSSDGCHHTLAPGASLTSPEAFVGFFQGDWDDGFNACRRYVGREILPPRPAETPLGPCTVSSLRPFRDSASWKAAIDRAAEEGAQFVSFGESTAWNRCGVPPHEDFALGDFSIGLGDYAEDRSRFPEGIRGLSDYVHRRGIKVFMMFEFERVDIRTANRGPRPWRPEWLVHQGGYPYRSWRQHVYLMCLGVREAAEWTLDQISRAIEAFDVDWLQYDSNEWAVCDDPTHDHGARDGEWAQIQGLYTVMKGLRERFPNLIIGNCTGGAQRADLGAARYSDHAWSDDIYHPSSVNRKYSYGLGSIYPTSYVEENLNHYPHERLSTEISLERLEWRAINRMMAKMGVWYEAGTLSAAQRRVLERVIATYRQIEPTLDGDRYVLIEPPLLVAPEHREAGQWEAYQYLSTDGRLASLFFYRCASPQASRRVALRGLEDRARYRVSSHSGRIAGVYRGGELMEAGIECRLPRPLSAEVVILSRVS